MARARGKLAFARLPLPAGGYWEDSAFMAQQAAEQRIKGVYQKNCWKFVFTHDIQELLEGLERKGFTVSPDVWAARDLTVFASEFRYPGMSTTLTEGEFRRLLEIAESVVAWTDAIVAS
jgi:HEPN domain-containing protein